MSDQIDELTRELSDLAASPAPVSGVDVAMAARNGRVRLRRRRATALGAVAVVAAVAAAVTQLPSVGDRSPAPAGTHVSAPPASATDPLVVNASFGWLPAGFAVNYLPARGGIRQRADGRIPQGGLMGPIVWLTTYPKGTTPPLGDRWYSGGPRKYRIDAPPVDGRPAYWVGMTPTSSQAPGGSGDWDLRWQTADGRWAELEASYMPGSSAQQTLHRIAEGVVVARKEIPLPFWVSALPKGFAFEQVDLAQGPQAMRGTRVPWAARIFFKVDGMSIGTTIQPDQPESAGSKPGSTDSTVRGAAQTCVREQGLQLCTSAMQGVDAYRAVGGPKAWLKHFTPLGTDRDKWTTHVLG
ncbi:hypothetical protein [Peterkaempfera griseoplana]|uniref:hypothetical protein n=1 Tax=Peterkaempfera griseoplana TaxID=66896 RepID=UPI0006E13F35|nr:hypothetical protein [Peterkaempfera griseoplana]